MDTTISVLSMITAILGVSLTILTAYLTYVTYTLESRVKKSTEDFFSEKFSDLQRKVETRLSLVDVAVQALCGLTEEKDKEDTKNDMYFVRHMFRLCGNSRDEIMKSLLAFEAAGKEVWHFIPYVERIRSMGKWPTDCETEFERILQGMRRSSDYL